MSEKILNDDQLEKVSGGTADGGNSLDPSYNKVVTFEEMKILAMGTKILVSHGPGRTQYAGSLKTFEKIGKSDRSYILEILCDAATGDVLNYIGGTVGANFFDVTVYKK